MAYESLTEEEESDEETEDQLRDELEKSDEYSSGSEETGDDEPPCEDLSEMLEGPPQEAIEMRADSPMPVALAEPEVEEEEPEAKKRRDAPPLLEVNKIEN